MIQIKSLLQQRKDYLLKLRTEKEKQLEKAPEGYLRVCKHRGKVQYYQRKDSKDFNGVYIRERELEIAQRLAQRDYDEQVLRKVEKELKAIDKFFAGCPKIKAEDIYQELHQGRQKLVQPISVPQTKYISDWEQATYNGKEIDITIPEIYTAKGERVRSKSEVIIADILNSEQIPYRYEAPLYLNGWGIFHPDFTVLHVRERKEVYWEHFGMMDDVEYVEKAVQKIMIYVQNGIIPGKNLILTYETKKSPLNQKIIRMMIQEYLKD